MWDALWVDARHLLRGLRQFAPCQQFLGLDDETSPGQLHGLRSGTVGFKVQHWRPIFGE
jgi:hypothetical protein